MKNVDTLVSIDLPDDVDLCIIGGHHGSDTKVLNEVKKVAEKRQEIHMMGALYGEDKIRAMKSATAGIFPSRQEPFGIVGLEWMLAGVPFAASYVGGMRDYLGEGDIALNCGTSKSSIEDSVKRLLSMSEDEKKARVCTGLDQAKKFGWDQVADRVLESYAISENKARVTSVGDIHLPEWILYSEFLS
jgi:glycosyltransferase involved in cell wall biosynthesis